MRSETVARSPAEIIGDVFRLLLHPVLPSGRRVRRVERIYHLNLGQRFAQINALKFASEIASFNQSAIMEYVFALAESHKSLRLSVELKANDINLKTSDLIRNMNLGFFQSVQGNFKFLHKHFLNRSPERPRIAILGNWPTEDRDEVIIIFRDTPVEYSNPFPLTESSALSYSAETGKTFICNDIPFAALTENYRNPRIDADKVRSIAGRGSLTHQYHRVLRSWDGVWSDGDNSSSSHYRSTMVVPIQIATEKLSEEIVNKFQAEDASRLVFGYLCIDHVEKDYFDEDIDSPVMNLVADIVSIFAFQRLRFTDFSSTFNLAQSLVDERDYSATFREAVDQLNAAIASNSPDVGEKSEPAGKSFLLGADDILLKAVESRAFIVEDAVN